MANNNRKIPHEDLLKALDLISNGKSVRQAASELGYKNNTLHDALTRPEYLEQYARAKSDGADALFDEIDKIVNDVSKDNEPFVGHVHVQRAKLRADTIKWKLSKLMPKKYGDKIDVEHSGEVKLRNVMPEDLRKKPKTDSK